MHFMRSYFKYVVYLIVLFVISSSHAGTYEAIFQAVIRDDASALASLLRLGADPNSRDPKGYPALSVAIQRESPRVVTLLLAQPGTDVNALNAAGESALMLAAIQGDLALCQRLLARGATVHQPGWSPLHYAASGPNVQVVQLLLDKGALLEVEAPNRTTPLMLAAQHGPEASVMLLLARGADPNRKNERNLQAADFALMGGRDWLVDRLKPTPR